MYGTIDANVYMNIFSGLSLLDPEPQYPARGFAQKLRCCPSANSRNIHNAARVTS